MNETHTVQSKVIELLIKEKPTIRCASERGSGGSIDSREAKGEGGRTPPSVSTIRSISLIEKKVRGTAVYNKEATPR